MSAALDALFGATVNAYTHPALVERGTTLGFSSLLCLGNRTVTGMLSTCGQQFVDWSAAYRLFERERIDPDVFFSVARTTALSFLQPEDPVVAFLDDTLIGKTGRKVTGASWHRDPLGPPFQTNLVWSQRFLQCSLALSQNGPSTPGPARAIPIAFTHTPTPKKPRRDAGEQDQVAYRHRSKQARLSAVGSAQIHALRAQLNDDPAHAARSLLIGVDGSFTNATVLKHLPARTTLIGRIRKDCKLYRLPDQQTAASRGRTRQYGEQLPTPEQMRQDPTIPWRTVQAWAAGKQHDFQIKSIGPVRWRSAGGEQNLRLIIIRPLAYRPRNGARLLYRNPTYLICTDPDLDLATLLQAYLWRWEIEVNFRDEKSLLGVGQAQVRTPETVERVPAFQVALYSFLLLAERMLHDPLEPLTLPLWRKQKTDTGKKKRRRATGDLIRHLRAEIWGKGLGVENFSGFAKNHTRASKPEKLENCLPSAIFYAT
ncbi:MAG: hypothetical protein WBQ23_03080 [Bacteroidota bacterium]